jgi:SAM-dependent methyltransferase
LTEPSRSFDGAAEEYERTRPDYPPRLLDVLPLADDAEVLDLGAGTGKLTRVLAVRYGRVIAVEPLDKMRAILERVVPAAVNMAGSAEAIPWATGAVDGVFAGQAFHWFANREAVTEIARVLRHGGVLALVWNGPDEDRRSPLPGPYLAYLDELHAAAAFNDAPPWQDVLAHGPFGEVQQAGVPHDHILDRAGLLDNARTVSWIASRPDAEREAVLERLATLLPEGTYAIPNRANVMWAVRT